MKLVRHDLDRRTRELLARRNALERRIGELITELAPLQKELHDAQVALHDIDREVARSLSDDELEHNIKCLSESTDRKNRPRSKERSPAHWEKVRRWNERRDEARKQLYALETEHSNRKRRATIAAKKKAREQADADARFTKTLNLE